MSVLGDLLTDTTSQLASDLFGESGDAAWRRAADVESQQQAGGFVALVYAAVAGCIWHPALPDLKTNEERRREVLSGTLLVPTSLGLTLLSKDRFQDAADVVWKPQTISDDINGFRHLLLTREDRKFSGQVKK